MKSVPLCCFLMLLILKIPLLITIATSLAITFISSIGGKIGKVKTGHVPLLLAVFIVIVNLIASPLGEELQIALATLIFITTFKIWFSIQ